MQPNHILYRLTLVALVVGASTGLVVYFYNEPFHTLANSSDMGTNLAHALATLLLVLATFATLSLVLVTFFRDASLKLQASITGCDQRDANQISAIHKVGNELRQVKTYNDVFRSQLGTIINETEQGCFQYPPHLQAINVK